jgi:hypothetical protein
VGDLGGLAAFVGEPLRQYLIALDLRPEDSLPLQVKRKFFAARLRRVEPGREIDVFTTR